MTTEPCRWIIPIGYTSTGDIVTATLTFSVRPTRRMIRAFCRHLNFIADNWETFPSFEEEDAAERAKADAPASGAAELVEGGRVE